MWRIVASASVVLVLSLGWFAPTASGLDNSVTAQVCQSGATASLVITQPVSDSVIRELPVEVAGSVELVNQLEVYIDGVYRQTEAIGAQQKTFSLDVTLQAGTRDIEVRGNNLCGGDMVTDNVVVTYQPPKEPEEPLEESIGAETPTVTNPNQPPGGGGGVVVSNPNPQPSSDESNWFSGLFGWLDTNGLLSWWFDITDTTATAERMDQDGWRIGLFVVGLILTATAGSIATTIAATGLVADVPRRWLVLGLRALGILLIILTLVVLL